VLNILWKRAVCPEVSIITVQLLIVLKVRVDYRVTAGNKTQRVSAEEEFLICINLY
jgi:hypothetical protein